jgi:hypothetical protein
VDTGATEHTYNNPRLFKLLRLNLGLLLVLIVAREVKPKGSKTVKLNVYKLARYKELILKRVLFMPDFLVNLFFRLRLFLVSRIICSRTKTLRDSSKETITSVLVS